MRDRDRRTRRVLATTITLIVSLSAIVYLGWTLRPLILPLIIGILLAYLVKPLRSAFKYRWLPNGVRVALMFVVFSGALYMTAKFVKANIPNEKEELEMMVRLKYKFNEKFDKMMEIDPATGKGNAFYGMIADDINPLRATLNESLALTPEKQEAFLNYYHGVEGYEPVPEKYYEYFLVNNKKVKEPQAARKEIPKPAEAVATASIESKQSFLKTIVGILSVWFLLPIVFFVFLFDDGAIIQFFIGLVPNRYFELMLSVKEHVDEAIGKYLRGISMECGLVGISMVVGLFLVGFPFKLAILVGFLAGVATAIPLVGPVVGLTLGLGFGLITEDINPLMPFVTEDNFLLAVLIVTGVVIALDNVIFQPIVLGSAVNLHPLVVILGIMGASMMLGAAGVLLAIPGIVVFKVIVQQTFRGLKEYRII